MPSRPAPSQTASEAPSILSAHAAFEDAPRFDRNDGIVVVFSSEVDASSLDPRFFLVIFEDGSRMRPQHALLSPASEADENRTVLLVGDFGDPLHRPPADVMVTGPLYGERGAKFRGLVGNIEAFAASGRPVLAEYRPAAGGDCAAGSEVVRTYWIDGLRGVEATDLPKIQLELDDGRSVAPTGFDDHQLGDEGGEDNVLDLCSPSPGPVRSVTFEAGIFVDPADHPSAAARLAVVAPEPSG